MVALMASLGLGEKKVLVLTHGVNAGAFRSARNLPGVHVMPFSDASTYHILWSDVLVIESAALAAQSAEA
jgi:large subunit ribosomal protein L4